MTHSDSKTGSSTSKTKQTGAEAAEDLRDTVHGAAGKVSSEVSGVADKVRTGAAQDIQQIADALHKAAGELNDGSSHRRMFDRLADNVEHVSKVLNDKSLGDMLGDLNDLARRNPSLFLGGAALAGFAATRLATSSETAHSSAQNTSSHLGNAPGTKGA